MRPLLLGVIALGTLAAVIRAQDAPTAATERLLELRNQRDALTPQERRSLLAGKVDIVIDAYLEAARTYGGDLAVPFLVDALELAPQRRTARDIVAIIAADYCKIPALEAIGNRLPKLKTRCGIKPANDLLAKIESESPSPRLRAWATLARLETTILSSKPGVDRYEAAKQEVTNAVEGVADDELRARFDALFAREHLTLGSIAPDIVGVDLDGVTLKLSDYKGKVVLLDFWGDW